MPPKTPDPGWKTGEQLEFLFAHLPDFRACQDDKTLGDFWEKLFNDWYDKWPLPHVMSEAHGSVENTRIMLRKEKNAVRGNSLSHLHRTNLVFPQQIKTWFNNRGRGGDSVKARKDLKLDTNEKRKLAPVQAYCSYAWATLQPIVLARWEGQKMTTTFNDDEDPLEPPSKEPPIPLAFKLKIAKEVFEALPIEAKAEIDLRREEDRLRLTRKISDIKNEEERIAKLQTHQKYRPLN